MYRGCGRKQWKQRTYVPKKWQKSVETEGLCNTTMVKTTGETMNGTTIQYQDQPLEIERKYLIRYPNLDLLDRICSGKAIISQTYLKSEKGLSRRVRKRRIGEKTEYWYTEKEKLSDLTRIEREHEISEQEYEEFLKEALEHARTIHKIRYFLPAGELCFEIDIFPEWDDRAFAEVELDDEKREITFPDCLDLIKEVTGDKRYTNASLAKHGFFCEELTTGQSLSSNGENLIIGNTE